MSLFLLLRSQICAYCESGITAQMQSCCLSLVPGWTLEKSVHIVTCDTCHCVQVPCSYFEWENRWDAEHNICCLNLVAALTATSTTKNSNPDRANGVSRVSEGVIITPAYMVAPLASEGTSQDRNEFLSASYPSYNSQFLRNRKSTLRSPHCSAHRGEGAKSAVKMI